MSSLLRRGFSFQSDGGTMTFRGYDNAWDLECAVQDTFAQAFSPNARAAYDGISPYAPYLLRIARNRVISEMRSRQRERRRREAFAEAPHEQPNTPEREAMQAELAALVERFRSQLDETDRRFLALRWSDELPLLEVARRLGLTRMRARTREKKIRARFLAFLRENGFSSVGDDRGGAGDAGAALLVLGLFAAARLERLS